MTTTTIEWTRNADGGEGKSWNPIRARFKGDGKPGWYCQKISPACKNCYAERRNRWIGNGANYNESDLRTVDVYLDEKALREPLRWRKPTNIFVCSMTDLFGSWVPGEWLDRIYAVMALCPQHTFIVLTKRPQRRNAYLRTMQNDDTRNEIWGETACDVTNSPCACLNIEDGEWPLPNVREMVTVCNQDEADALIPILLATPASCRGLSVEPILGPLDLRHYLPSDGWQHTSEGRGEQCSVCHRDLVAGEGYREFPQSRWDRSRICYGCGLDWVIVGGESGPGARRSNVDWMRRIVAQCAAAHVPVFVKQLGAKPGQERDTNGDWHPWLLMNRKGADPSEWPADLRVQQVPGVRQ